MQIVKISLLGSPRIERDHIPLEVDTRKAIALLAYLVVTGESHHRDTLATFFWPELDQVHARSALRRTLSTLKNSVVGDVLNIQRDIVGIHPEKIWLDVLEFRRTLAACPDGSLANGETCEQCLASLQSAINLYRGDFMAGFTLRDSASFDDWQFFQTEGLRRELAGTLEKMVTCQAAHGEFEIAIDYARHWLSLDPLHEAVHRQLMRLYASAGRREAALRQYQECARILETELGVSPQEKTFELFLEIKENRFLPTGALPQKPASLPLRQEQPGSRGKTADSFSGSPPAALPLVGRSLQWERLTKIYASLIIDGHFAVIEGEAGIGKTRLSEEFLAWASSRGAIAIQARCYAGEKNLSYRPIVEGLQSAISQKADSTWLAGIPDIWLAEAARLLPQLREVRPDLPGVSALESLGAQSRFFEAIDRTLTAVSRGSAPGILFLDDLQWADAATVDLLSYLVRRSRGRPLLILGTWRSEEVGPGHRLRRLLGESQRAGLGSLISLSRLTRAEVEALVKQLLLDDSALDLGDRLFAETEGLPFFLAEYISAFQQGDQPTTAERWNLPGSVRDLLHSRLAVIDETSWQLLTTAAAIGRSFGYDTLRETSGRDEDETIRALEVLVSQGLIAELKDLGDESEPFYDFKHEKLRSLVYAETGLARRRLLHRRIAEALIRRDRLLSQPGSLAGTIAHHYRLGGMSAEAAHFFQLAGEHARKLYANANALEHFRAALHLGHPQPSKLHEAIGDMHMLLGDYASALNSYSLATTQRNDGELGRLEHKQGNVYQRQGNWEQAERHYRLALMHATESGLDEERTRILADWSLVAYLRKSHAQAQELAQQAMAGAEEIGDRYALSQAHNILGILARHQEDLPTAIHHLEQSLAIAENLADPGVLAAALNNLAFVYNASGDLERAIQLTEKALEWCAVQGDRHRQAALHSNLADLLHETGQAEAAMEHLKKSAILFAEVGAEAGNPNPEIWKLTEW